MPANRFEVLECRAALDAVAENAQDTPPLRTGALDVLAQHMLGRACGEPFLRRRALRRGARAPRPMPALARADFDAVVDFVATGGYALKAYERFAKIRQGKDGRWRVAHPTRRAALPHECRHHRRGRHAEGAAGALARLGKMIPRGGRLLGEVEEYFIEKLAPGDTFVFAGEILRYEALVEDEVYVSRADRRPTRRCRPTRAASSRSRPISPSACARMLADPQPWRALPDQVREWLEIQQWRSLLPRRRELLVETFPRADKYYLVCYPFEGRLAHQTLGMLLTRRLERARLRPLGFVANEYALAVWGLGDVGAAHRARRAVARRSCSTRTCWATTSKPGSPNRR